MNFDNALELQRKIFRKIYNYVEVPGSFASESDDLQAGPLYLAPDRADGRTAIAEVRSSTDLLAVGIGVSPPAMPSAGRETNREYFIIAYCQDRRLLRSTILDAMKSEASNELRATYVGPVRQMAASWEQFMQRPLRVGSSIGHSRATASTLGGFVTFDGNAQGLLSNNHVLADVNQARVGDLILQPGRIDGGKRAEHHVGTLHKYVPIGFGAADRNIVDAAIAKLLPGVSMDACIYNSSANLGICGSRIGAAPDIEESVIKVGRTTGFTRGRIQSLRVNNLLVSMSSRGMERMARFDGQIVVEGLNDANFSKPGDSGAIVMNESYEPVGLLFAGSKSGGTNNLGLTFVNPIQPVLERLECEFMK